MSAAINQFGLHTIEYSIRKQRLQDPLYAAAHSEALPRARKLQSIMSVYFISQMDFFFLVLAQHNTPLLSSSINLFYADQLAKNIWSKPSEDSPSMYKVREGEQFVNPNLRHTLELNSPYVPYGGYVHPRIQNKWEDISCSPPNISKTQPREKFSVVLSSMSKYFGFPRFDFD